MGTSAANKPKITIYDLQHISRVNNAELTAMFSTGVTANSRISENTEEEVTLKYRLGSKK